MRFAAFLILITTLLSLPVLAETDEVYQRVMQKQAIDCGYAEWPPFFVIDPNTKRLSGLMYDVWELIGKKLDLKINWKTTVGWGDVTEAVRTKKFDVFCVGVSPDAGRMKNMLMSRAVFYTPMFLYSRADDKRFDNNYALLNNSQFTTVGQEGTFIVSVLATKFPTAKTANTAPSSPFADVYQNIISKKGDVMLMDAAATEDYMKQNPGKLRRVSGLPVTLVPLFLPLASSEHQFKALLDLTLSDLINNGDIEALIKKYGLKETYSPQADVTLPTHH